MTPPRIRLVAAVGALCAGAAEDPDVEFVVGSDAASAARDSDARYVVCLAAGELTLPGGLERLADALDDREEVAFAWGPGVEWRVRELVRKVPDRIDPFRIALTNEYPAGALYRRTALAQLGGWRRLTDAVDAQSDWNLWMALAEHGHEGIHLGRGELTYVHFVRRNTLTDAGRRDRRALRGALRRRHPGLFDDLAEHRRASSLNSWRRLLYPVVYGDRSRLGIEARFKHWLDRLGFWTLSSTFDTAQRRALDAALAGGARRPPSAGPSRVAVIVPSYENGAEAVRAVRSIDESEAIEVIVVDDGSTDPQARRALRGLGPEEATVIRHDLNLGVSAARMTALRHVSAPYVFALDADDLAVRGALGRMADRLDASPGASVCFGDYAELQVAERRLAASEPVCNTRIDPADPRLAAAMVRAAAIGSEGRGAAVGGPAVRARWVNGRRAGAGVRSSRST